MDESLVRRQVVLLRVRRWAHVTPEAYVGVLGDEMPLECPRPAEHPLALGTPPAVALPIESHLCEYKDTLNNCGAPSTIDDQDDEHVRWRLGGRWFLSLAPVVRVHAPDMSGQVALIGEDLKAEFAAEADIAVNGHHVSLHDALPPRPECLQADRALWQTPSSDAHGRKNHICNMKVIISNTGMRSFNRLTIRVGTARTCRAERPSITGSYHMSIGNPYYGD